MRTHGYPRRSVLVLTAAAVLLAGCGDGGGGASIASSRDIPAVIENWGIEAAKYDPATGYAGVMKIKGVTPPQFPNPKDTLMYSLIVGTYGAQLEGRLDPQLELFAPLGTKVISMVTGTVCGVPKLYSNDFSVRIAPPNTPCQGDAAAILFEHEHLINPVVKPGDRVTAGQQIGEVSDYKKAWTEIGFGIIELGVAFTKSGSDRPWHACPTKYLAPSRADELKAVMASILQGWMDARNDPTMYDLAKQNPVGCEIPEDIEEK